MGLFDRFRNKNKPDAVKVDRQPVEQLPFEVKFSQFTNGNLQVDFYDKNSDFNKFYDTTRLIIRRQPLNIEGHRVYNCAVSWYGSSDCQMFNKKTGQLDSLRAQEYRGVLAEIDLGLLQTNPDYCSVVMKGLLDKKRVERYLENGLQETPENPCGKFIGGVIKTEKGFCKYFSTVVGQVSHNSELMVNRRREHRRKVEEQRQQAIEVRKAEIERLQEEIRGLEEK